MIVMTSNVGTGTVKQASIGFSVHARGEKTEDTAQTLLEALQQRVPPDFLNRVDNIIDLMLCAQGSDRHREIKLANRGKLLRDRRLSSKSLLPP